MASLERIHRLLRLIDQLQSGRNYNTTQLAEMCDVSRRTVFRDLKTLEESGLPVVYDAERQGYSMVASTLLPPTDFTLEETLSMLVLCDDLGHRDTGIPFQGASRSAALKLLSNLPQHLREYVGELSESIQIRLDPLNPLSESEQIFLALERARSERRKIRIHYQSLFEQRSITTLLSPYHLLFSRRSWYVIARSSLHRAVRTFNVGRIQKAELTDNNYEIPPRFSLKRFFGNAWHLIRDRKNRADVVVRFQPKVATNVSEVRWHHTQKLKWNSDGTLDFHATVDGLEEIQWWILGYGDQAEVIAPPALRDMIRNRVDALQKIYGSTSQGHKKSTRSTQRKKTPRSRASK